ncbi:Guanine nucleotide-binding protein subunit beta-like protein, partial [Hondaea fermentalgiana]
IWNATSGEEQHVLKGHSVWVTSVAIQGDTIVSGSSDQTVCIWNAIPSDKEQHGLTGHSDLVTSVAIQGDTIVSGSSDKTVRIWNATSGEEQHVLKGHSKLINSVAIQGDTVVSGSDDNTMRIWNATSGEELHVFKGHSGEVYSVAIQGETIVSGSEDKTVRIWNATSGEAQHVLKGHSDYVVSVAIEGNTIVSGSHDSTVRIWNAISGEEQHVLYGHNHLVLSVAIQGYTIVSQSCPWARTRYWNAQTGEALDADEVEASILPGIMTSRNVENRTHVKLSGGIGFTMDHEIHHHCHPVAHEGSVYVVGDALYLLNELDAEMAGLGSSSTSKVDMKRCLERMRSRAPMRKAREHKFPPERFANQRGTMLEVEKTRGYGRMEYQIFMQKVHSDLPSTALSRKSGRSSGGSTKRKSVADDLSNDLVSYRGLSVAALKQIWQDVLDETLAPRVQ